MSGTVDATKFFRKQHSAAQQSANKEKTAMQAELGEKTRQLEHLHKASVGDMPRLRQIHGLQAEKTKTTTVVQKVVEQVHTNGVESRTNGAESHSGAADADGLKQQLKEQKAKNDELRERNYAMLDAVNKAEAIMAEAKVG